MTVIRIVRRIMLSIAAAIAMGALGLAAHVAWLPASASASPSLQGERVPDQLLEVIPQPDPRAGEFVPHAIAVRPDGSFYVLDGDAARVQRFDAEGRFVSAFGGFGTAEGQMIQPTAIALAPDGSVAVLDPLGLAVQRFEADGTWRSRIRLPLGSVSGRGGLAVASDGTTWVAAKIDIVVWKRSDAWLMRFDESGRMLAQIRLPAPFSSQHVVGIALTSDGGALVANRVGDVLRLDELGAVVATWRTPMQVQGVALAADGTLWVAGNGNVLRRLSMEGVLIEERQLPSGDGPAPLSDVALGADGRIWTSEGLAPGPAPTLELPTRRGRVRVWDGGDRPVAEWRSEPSIALRVVSALAPSADGGMWAIDRNHGILRFDAAGRVAATWPISRAYAIADLGGRILVADEITRQTRVFEPDGQLVGPLLLDGGTPLPARYRMAPGHAGQTVFLLGPDTTLERLDLATGRLEILARRGIQKGSNESIVGLAAFDDGGVVVADGALDRLQIFGPNGVPPRVLGFDPLLPCDPDTNLQSPRGVVAEAGGTMIAIDHEAHRLRRFGRDGALLAAWGESGAAPGMLRAPAVVAQGAAGELWVEDSPLSPHTVRSGNLEPSFQRRLQRFGPAPATHWRAEAFADGAMGGDPIAVTRTATVRLDAGRTLLADPPEGWTARFTRPIVLEAGRHRFDVRAAGGVRLWVGDRLALDHWTSDAVSETVTLDVHDAAMHFTRLDYRPVVPAGAAAELSLETAVGPIPPGTASPTPPATATLLPQATLPPAPTPSPMPTRIQLPPLPNALYLPRALSGHDDVHPTPEAPTPTSPAPHLPLEGIDVLHYAIAVRLDEAAAAEGPPGTPTPAPLRASAVTTVTVGLTAETAWLALNAEPAGMRMRGIDVGGQPVSSWRWVPGQANRFGLTGTRLVVPLPARAAVGTVVTATFRYDIRMSGDTRFGYGMLWALDGGRRVVQSRNSEYYARYWLPSHDHPSDAATADIVLDLPESIGGASNGELVADTQDDRGATAPPGRRILRWRQADPIQTYLLYVLMGDLQEEHGQVCYGIVDGVGEVQDCAVAQHRVPYSNYWASSRRGWPTDSAAEVVAYFAGLFGPYPQPKLGVASVPHPYSMEYTSLFVVTDPRSRVHELIHMWWGADVVIDGWSDFWLKEGITDYFDLYAQEQNGSPGTSYPLQPCHPGRLFQPGDVDGMALLEATGPDEVSYLKAAATIHDLRWRIALAGGLDIWDEPARLAFEGAFRDLYRAFRGRALTAEAMVEHFGRRLGPVMREAGMTVDDATASRIGSAWLTAWKGRQAPSSGG